MNTTTTTTTSAKTTTTTLAKNNNNNIVSSLAQYSSWIINLYFKVILVLFLFCEGNYLRGTRTSSKLYFILSTHLAISPTLLIIWLFDVHFAIQGLKMAKTKELSRDMRNRIIERHKGGQGYRKISKEMNLALSTVGNIIRKYKKYGDGSANLPRNGRPRKINERTSRWISRNVQINPFITCSEIKTDFEGAGINVS